MKVLLTHIILLLTSITLTAQPITWERTYDNSQSYFTDFARAICESDSGNYFIAGSSLISVPTNHYRIWLIKIDPYGDTLFTRLVGLPGSTTRAAVSDSKGGCVIAGYSGQSFTTCIDKYGNVVWERSYGGSSVQMHKIIRTSDGGYVACGRISLRHGYLLKIDSVGFLEWQRVFTSPFSKVFFDVAQVGTEFFVIGDNETAIPDTANIALSRFDSDGNLISEKEFSISGRQCVGYDVICNQNDLIIGGGTTDENNTRGQLFFARVDTSANVLYEKIFDSPYRNYFGSMKLSSENRYVFALSTIYGFSLLPEAIVTDSLGNTVYRRTFYKSNRNEGEFYELIVDHNKDIIFVGLAVDDFYSDVVYACRTDSSLYSKTDKVGDFKIESKDFALLENYPNPFNSSTIIKISLSSKDYMRLDLFDVSGKFIACLLDERLNAGVTALELSADMHKLSSGVYFIKMTSQKGFTKIKKIISLK